MIRMILRNNSPTSSVIHLQEISKKEGQSMPPKFIHPPQSTHPRAPLRPRAKARHNVPNDATNSPAQNELQNGRFIAHAPSTTPPCLRASVVSSPPAKTCVNL